MQTDEIGSGNGKVWHSGMERIQDRETRRFLIMLAAVFVAVALAANGILTVMNRRQRQEEQQIFAAFLGNVSARYPEVQEEEWISLMNESENREAGRELLRRYGILEGQETFLVRERYYRGAGLLMNGGYLALFAGLCGLFAFRWKKRKVRLDELTEYLRRVSHGEYMLEPEKQGEDELSYLQSELYKVIVLLREQAELMREQRVSLAQSVSDISHQLKTPLTSAMVLVDNLQENSHMEEETRRHFLTEITSQLSGMAWLVAVMLKLARFDAGVVELEKEEVSLMQILKQVLEGLEQQAEWREVSLRLHFDMQAEEGSQQRDAGENVQERQADIRIPGDAKWLKEAFSNIVKNAIEHSPQKEEVTLWVQDNEVYTAISIRNNGVPISAEEQKHIFERFYQRKSSEVSAAEKRSGMENVGIGLALAKEIIERQNGMIFVDSSEEDGTVFTVKFIKGLS